MFVTFKGGKACKSLRLEMFQRMRHYPVTKCKLTMKTENSKTFFFVINSILSSLLLVKLTILNITLIRLAYTYPKLQLIKSNTI